MSRRRPSDDELKSMLTEGHFGETAALVPAEPLGRTPMLLDIERITCYEDNPRTDRNPLYDNIRESIRHQGLQQPLVVTRRPGAERYVVKAGGNTRLAVLKDLHETTGDPRYQQVHCLFEPWTSESEVLTAHLIENDTRGELSFIDKARAVRKLKSLIESETGTSLTQERLTAALRERGYRLERSMLSRIDYAVDTLLPAIPQVLRAGMGQPQIQRIRRLDRAARRLWLGRELGTSDEFDQVLSTLLSRYDGAEWDLDRLRRAIEKEIAEITGEDLPRISLELDAVMNGQAPQAGRHGNTPADDTETTQSGLREMQADMTGDASVTSRSTMTSGTEVTTQEPGNSREEHAPTDTARQTDALAPTHRASAAPEHPVLPPPDNTTDRDRPNDPKSLRSRTCVLATRLARCNELGDIVVPLGNRGAGFLVDFVFTGEDDDADTRIARAALWWFLASVAEQFHAPPAAVRPHLPAAWEGRPIAGAIAGDESDVDLLAEYALIDIGPLLGPLVFARVNDRSWSDLLDLLGAYRDLKHTLRATGSALWEAPP